MQKNGGYMSNITFDDLQKATEKAVALLQEKGNPHLQIIVTQTDVKIVEEQMGIPIQFNN